MTTRVGDPAVWGEHCDVHAVAPTNRSDSAQILLDMTEDAGSSEAAQQLAERLGYLPLALHLAGAAIASQYSTWRTFESFQERVDQIGPHILIDDSDQSSTVEPRRVVLQTWELSLDALRRTMPASRVLMRIIVCLAPATPLPVSMLRGDVIAPAFPGLFPPTSNARALSVEQHLRVLARTGLVEVSLDATGTAEIIVHSLVAETCRVHTANGSDTARTKDQLYASAAELAADLASRLRIDEPESWPHWRQLIPHLHAVIEVTRDDLPVAQVDRLLTATHAAMGFLLWTCDVRAEQTLGSLALSTLVPRATDLATSIAVRGRLVLANGHLDALDQLQDSFRELIAEGNHAGLADTPELLEIRQEMAHSLREKGDLPVSIDELRSVYEARGRVLGPEDRDTLHSLHELGRVIGRAGQHGEALAIFQQVVPARLRTVGSDNPRTLAAQHELASELATVGLLEEGATLMREVLRRRTEMLGPEHSGTLETRQALALLVARLGQADNAISELRTVRAFWDRLFGTDHAGSLEASHDLGAMHESIGQLSEEETEYGRAARGSEVSLGTAHPSIDRKQGFIRCDPSADRRRPLVPVFANPSASMFGNDCG